jgi:hypothetical protein
MVSRSNRAQLILIGALLLATIVFGLSFLLNSLLFNSAGASSPASVSVVEAEGTTFETQRSLRSLAVRVNHERRNVSLDPSGATPALNATFEANVTRFGRLLAESKATAGTRIVNVSFNNDSSRWGYRIVQAHDDDFRKGTDITTDWSPVPDTPDAAVRWFTVNVNATSEDLADNQANAFTVDARNDTASFDLAIWKQDQNNVSISVDGNPPITCGGIEGRILLDLYRGQAHTDDCEFQGVRSLGDPVSIEFEEPEHMAGRYSIVVNRTRSSHFSDEYTRCVDSSDDGRPPSDADPCVAPALWTANVTTTVHSDRLAYENTYNLSVYGGES